MLDAPWIENWKLILRERFEFYDKCGMEYSAETKAWLEHAAGPPVMLDVLLAGEEVVRLGKGREVVIMHLPGHTPGFVGVFDTRSRALIASDAVLWKGMVDVDGRVEGPPPYFDLAAYRRSLTKILSLDFEWLLLSHYPPMDGGSGRKFVRESLEHTQAMETSIRAVVAQSRMPTPLRDICRVIEQQFGPYPVMANELAAPVWAHLTEMVREGKARMHEATPSGAPAWSAP